MRLITFFGLRLYGQTQKYIKEGENKMITKDELMTILRISKEAVEEELGPIRIITTEGKKENDLLSYNTFLYLVSSLCPKGFNMTYSEEKEDWQR